MFSGICGQSGPVAKNITDGTTAHFLLYALGRGRRIEATYSGQRFMSLSRLERSQQNISPRCTMGIKIGLLVSLLLGTAIILLAIASASPGTFESSVWQLDVFVISVVTIPIVVILRMIVRQIRATFTRYAEFVENLGKDGYPELKVEQSSKEFQKLGFALNNAHQRLQQRTEPQSSSASRHRFSSIVDASPNIVLLMDANGEVQYLNSRGRQVADAIGLDGEDVSAILPLTPSALVKRCIGNNEVLRDQEVSYRDRKFSWTLIPLHGEQMLQAHGTVVAHRRKTDYQKLVSSPDGTQSRLYSIEKHPDYQRYRGSILVIDSDELMQGLMTRYFQKEGFCVITASNGEEGLKLAEQHKPDLITLDIMMPGKNGWMVLSALKDDARLASIPVVVISSVGNRRFVHAMGADDYVTKPVNWRVLGKTISKLSGNHRELGALQ